MEKDIQGAQAKVLRCANNISLSKAKKGFLVQILYVPMWRHLLSLNTNRKRISNKNASINGFRFMGNGEGFII